MEPTTVVDAPFTDAFKRGFGHACSRAGTYDKLGRDIARSLAAEGSEVGDGIHGWGTPLGGGGREGRDRGV